MELLNIKEKRFFELLEANSILEDRSIDTAEKFGNAARYLMHEQSGVLGELKTEIEDNLLLHKKKEDRLSYLKRLSLKANEMTELLEERIISFSKEENKSFMWQVNYPDKRIYFEMPGIRIMNIYRTSISYLQFLNAIIKLHSEVEFDAEAKPELKNEVYKNNPKIKWQVSKEQCYDVFKKLHTSGYVNNTTDELADFIHAFIEFKGKRPSIGTIRSELRRKNSKPYKGKEFIMPKTK